MFSDRLLERIQRARRICVLTGAGISAESGIPTFRDQNGIWQKYRPEELATVEALLSTPAIVQEWYAFRRRILDEKAPNPGHLALAEMERLFPDFTLVTQNVDGFHQRAGSRNVLELHGNILRNYCIDCRAEAEATLSPIENGEIARCKLCNGLIRPDVVWFGEMLPAEAFEKATAAAARADVFLSIGTSGVVYPAAGLPLQAKENGAFVAEINTEPSAVSPYLDEVIVGKAGTVLPRLLELLKVKRKPA